MKLTPRQVPNARQRFQEHLVKSLDYLYSLLVDAPSLDLISCTSVTAFMCVWSVL